MNGNASLALHRFNALVAGLLKWNISYDLIIYIKNIKQTHWFWSGCSPGSSVIYNFYITGSEKKADAPRSLCYDVLENKSQDFVNVHNDKILTFSRQTCDAKVI